MVVQIVLIAKYSCHFFFFFSSGKMETMIDIAIYGASYLYERHVRNHGESPIGITEIICASDCRPSFSMISISIVPDKASMIAAMICGSGDTSVR